jgi:hypothetical protein
MADSPLTSARSLGSSVAFHAALLLAASLAVFGVLAPVATAPPGVVLEASSEPVDNRVTADDAGGGPGELGGLEPPDAVRITVLPDPVTSRRGGDTPADRAEAALRAGVLADPAPMEAPVSAGLDGPALSRGMGVLPGPGLGGGGGSGGGSGGGIGTGVGPGTEFFGARVQARSFAYVIDRSGSMSGYGALETAKRELMASLELLPPDAQFAVFFYNIQPRAIAGPDGRPGLRPATAAAKEAVRAGLAEIHATGGTEHAAAIRAALAVEPEVLFFLTDGLLMTPEIAAELERAAGRTRIEAISFGTGPEPAASDPVRELATATGGSYRYVDVLRYGKPEAAAP